ncbi:class I SAM-dependent methyltransferase [Rhodococcus sp. ARC_M5]|uniref:class I SAM-dependent methyltransferase n=1 Tax=Rhodococcus sp. ARC_M5 TaxID=2928851 RepID=UPI001FB2C552|nr:methyltransferase [Rhodococcus sp. ARC_M5]MCJ0893934.1 methyltransferase [Rhodococcus sp. ARC_M5]
MTAPSTRPGAAPYSKLFLAIYDLWVIRLSNDYGWRCNRKHFVDLYREHIGRRHLEVGPGSGWVLANIDLPSDIDLTLVDLNANSLEHTASRLDVSPTLIEHDVMLPLPENVDTFDSASINYVLHCLPGDWSTKSRALTNLADVLTPDGVLFGSTVIGVDQKYTTLGAALMFAYNRIGAFGNRCDDLPGLRQLLSERFEHVDVTMVGNVALIVAKNPLDAQQRAD